MAFDATGIGGVGLPWHVTFAADGDTGKQYIRRLRTPGRLRVTAFADKHLMRGMIELRVLKPAWREIRFRDRRDSPIGRSDVVTLFAGLYAQKQFSLVDAGCDPGRCVAWGRGWLRAGHANLGTGGRAKLFRMGGDPRGKLPRQKIVNDIRVLVRHRLIDAAVEHQRMTSGAMLVIVHRRHVFTASRRCGNRGSIRPGLGITGTVAIGTHEGHVSGAAPQVFPEMNGMVEFNGSRIFQTGPLRCELRMATREGVNSSGHLKLPSFCFQVAVAGNALTIAYRGEPGGRVFRVTIGARGSKGLIRLVDRAIMTGRAGLVCNAGGKRTGADMAYLAFLVQHGVRRRERTGVVDRAGMRSPVQPNP